MRREELAWQDRLHRKVWVARRIVGLAVILVAWLAMGPNVVDFWSVLVPIVVYASLVIYHGKVQRARRHYGRAVGFYEKGLARLNDQWMGQGEPGERFRDGAHPYAEDLDLFGAGSLFELLCTARTRMGESTLASWLLAPAPTSAILARQAAIEELRTRLDLREDLALIGAEIRSGVHPKELEAWGEGSPARFPKPARLIAPVLVLCVAAAFSFWYVRGFQLWLLIPLLLEGIFTLRLRDRVQRVLTEVEKPTHDLDLLSKVLGRLERERFSAPRLVELHTALQTEGIPAWRQIVRLDRMIQWLDSHHNPLFAVIAPFLLWSEQFAFAIERWRRSNGPNIKRWIAAVGEIETLSALAGYAFEHPADPFPELVEGAACFEAEGLGHPLIPEALCARNDLSLGGSTRALVVSGSNMSGKSTLLRAIGTNGALAFAGATVRARQLRLSPLTVGASIRIQDSLQAHSSRFYAEITRLRLLMDLASGPRTLLFLIDELLNGTNSHDRQIGAEAMLRGLLDRGAMGLITTHDLALARIADALAPRVENVHFEDHLEEGKMSFDYRMRAGVVTKSNAIALMRSVGLDV
ncbi:MAG: DNA mismatch repair protein MutS [Acidobacteria bacterium]|nr:DNA mismatch repair protein MutS [Acidobacteriota bacterium]